MQMDFLQNLIHSFNIFNLMKHNFILIIILSQYFVLINHLYLIEILIIIMKKFKYV